MDNNNECGESQQKVDLLLENIQKGYFDEDNFYSYSLNTLRNICSKSGDLMKGYTKYTSKKSSLINYMIRQCKNKIKQLYTELHLTTNHVSNNLFP